MVDVPAWRVRPNAPPLGSPLGPIGDVPIGGAKEYRFGRGRSTFSMFVVRVTDTEVRGYLNLCPHFSLPLNHEPDRFVHLGFIRCVQHFAIFTLDEGLCVAGACEGRRLDPVGLSCSADGMLAIEE